MLKSETIGELAKALCKAQSEFGPLLKGAVNPFFKSRYSDLASVMDVARGPLFDNGLSFTQTNDDAPDGFVTVETTLIHSSGEWISGKLKLPVSKQDPQGYGSAITYCRRYALQAILGLAAEDDDAESAMKRKPDKTMLQKATEEFAKISAIPHLDSHLKKHKTEYDSDKDSKAIYKASDKRRSEIIDSLNGGNTPDPDWMQEQPELVSPSDVTDIEAMIAAKGVPMDKFLAWLKLGSIAEIPKTWLPKVCKQLQSKPDTQQ